MRNSVFTGWLNKISFGVILIFILTIPLYSSVSVRLLLVALLVIIIINHRKFRIKNYILKTWDIIAYLLVLCLGIIYSEDWKTGMSVLETSFSLLALSFIYSHSQFLDRSGTSVIFYSFMTGLAIACLICLINATILFARFGDTQVYFFYNLTQIINSHPTYLAYYLIASITYVLYQLYYESKHPLLYVTVGFFFIMLMLTGGRTTYISLLLVLAFFILKYMIDDSHVKKAKVFLLVIFLLMALLGISSLDYFKSELNVNNDYWERSQLWYSAIKANPNSLIGVGTGDYKTVLNDYYLSHDLEKFAKDSYNSHNQFIQFYFSNGIFGLLILVIMIARPLYLSIKSQNALGILIIFPFVIYGVTEVFLGRYQGVVFFALMHQIVIYQHYSSKPPAL